MSSAQAPGNSLLEGPLPESLQLASPENRADRLQTKNRPTTTLNDSAQRMVSTTKHMGQNDWSMSFSILGLSPFWSEILGHSKPFYNHRNLPAEAHTLVRLVVPGRAPPQMVSQRSHPSTGRIGAATLVGMSPQHLHWHPMLEHWSTLIQICMYECMIFIWLNIYIYIYLYIYIFIFIFIFKYLCKYVCMCVYVLRM